MITYQCDLCTDRYIISIEGHAGAAPEGQDIVCAAASALALTLVEAVRNLDARGCVSHLSREVGKGSVQLDFTVKEDALPEAEAIVGTITDGFLLLEENCSEYICVG